MEYPTLQTTQTLLLLPASVRPACHPEEWSMTVLSIMQSRLFREGIVTVQWLTPGWGFRLPPCYTTNYPQRIWDLIQYRAPEILNLDPLHQWSIFHGIERPAEIQVAHLYKFLHVTYPKATSSKYLRSFERRSPLSQSLLSFTKRGSSPGTYVLFHQSGITNLVAIYLPWSTLPWITESQADLMQWLTVLRKPRESRVVPRIFSGLSLPVRVCCPQLSLPVEW